MLYKFSLGRRLQWEVFPLWNAAAVPSKLGSAPLPCEELQALRVKPAAPLSLSLSAGLYLSLSLSSKAAELTSAVGVRLCCGLPPFAKNPGATNQGREGGAEHVRGQQQMREKVELAVGMIGACGPRSQGVKPPPLGLLPPRHLLAWQIDLRTGCCFPRSLSVMYFQNSNFCSEFSVKCHGAVSALPRCTDRVGSPCFEPSWWRREGAGG